MGDEIQNEYVPEYAVPPGETLQEVLEGVPMSQAELARRMGRTPKMVNEIVAGKAPITPETALLLERVLGIPARLWNTLERHYREDLARLAARAELEKQAAWLETMPVRQMIELGWIRAYPTKVDQLREVLAFFGVASSALWDEMWLHPQAALRQSPAFVANPAAVAAWLRKGTLEARQVDCLAYDRRRFLDALNQVRTLTVDSLESACGRLIDLCAAAGVAVVLVPSLPKTRACGAARWLTPDKALIQLCLRYRSDDQLWFAFFHEAGHILLHGKREVFVDVPDDEATDKEREASRFAADFLIPRAQWQRFERASHYYSQSEIRSFAACLEIAPGIVVGRLQKESLVPFGHLNGLKRRLEWRIADGCAVVVERQQT